MTTLTAPGTQAAPPREFGRLTPCEEQAIERLIAGLRRGDVGNVALRHLEVDGVLQLDPLVELTGGGPCD